MADDGASCRGVRGASARVMVATLVLAAALFLPWAQSGRVSRSGWHVVSSARRLEVVESGAGEIALIVFFAIPALAFAVVVLFALDLHGWVAAASLVTVAVTLLVAVAIMRSPLDLRWGLWLNSGVAVADLMMIGQLSFRLGVTRE